MKPLLVGEACNVPGGEPFSGRSGAFLAGLIGTSLDEFMLSFDRVNLLRTWPGRREGAVKGHLFDLPSARRAARRLDVAGRTVVLAGKRVARAFGLNDPPWLKPVWLGWGEAAAFVIPHPSGIVRFYNDDVNRVVVGRLLRKAVRACRSG